MYVLRRIRINSGSKPCEPYYRRTYCVLCSHAMQALVKREDDWLPPPLGRTTYIRRAIRPLHTQLFLVPQASKLRKRWC